MCVCLWLITRPQQGQQLLHGVGDVLGLLKASGFSGSSADAKLPATTRVERNHWQVEETVQGMAVDEEN